MEETNEICAQALIDVAALLLLRHGCITVEEAEGLVDLAHKEEVTAKGLRNLILGLEDRALSCDKKDAALAAIRLLREAWKGLAASSNSSGSQECEPLVSALEGALSNSSGSQEDSPRVIWILEP